MPRSLRAFLLALAVAAHATVASAGHHQWIISELYSNADGTVQFVELLGVANNEQFINGFFVNTLGPEGLIPTSVPIGPNLPNGLTAGAYLLIGTAGYAALAAQQGAPAPDRVLPNNFLEIAADRVRYAGIPSTDIVYTNLPTDGIDSLDLENPSGTVNTPENFAGDTGSIDASPEPVPSLGMAAVVLLGALLLAIGTGTVLRRQRRAA
jgi:hypothetical protein